MPYPSAWPEIDARAECSAVLGTFENTPLEMSWAVPDQNAVFLSQLLQSAASSNFAAEVPATANDKLRLIAVSPPKFTLVTASGAKTELESEGTWSCDGSGFVDIVFPEIDFAGEGSWRTAWRVPYLRLTVTSDGALVMRYTTHRGRRAFVDLSQSDSPGNWLLFRRLR